MTGGECSSSSSRSRFVCELRSLVICRFLVASCSNNKFAAQDQSQTNPKLVAIHSLAGVKDGTLVSVIDEIVQLWTNMWIADARHDNTIAENIQGMQKRSASLLEQLVQELRAGQSADMSQMQYQRRKLSAAAMSGR